MSDLDYKVGDTVLVDFQTHVKEGKILEIREDREYDIIVEIEGDRYSFVITEGEDYIGWDLHGLVYNNKNILSDIIKKRIHTLAKNLEELEKKDESD